jgi:toxin ParE1/3/4
VTRYVLSPKAQADIEAIWNYSIRRWSLDQAERYVRVIQTEIEQIASDPSRGHSCDEIRAGYRKIPAGSHILFYRVTDRGVDIVRILHRRMDFERHL